MAFTLDLDQRRGSTPAIAHSWGLDEPRADGEQRVANGDGFAARERDDPTQDGIDEADIERVMREVPKGAWALSGLTVGLLLLCWLLIYAYVFLPRGMVS